MTTAEYAQYLISQANELLARNAFEEVLMNILVPHNNYRSGWTDDISGLYHHPKDEQERALSTQLSEILKRTVVGLLSSSHATTEYLGYAKLEYIATFLYRLGAQAPSDLVTRVTQLITESQALGAPERLFLTVPALQLLAEIPVE